MSGDLRDRVRATHPGDGAPVPPFAAVWAAALERRARAVRRYRALAAGLVGLALVVLAVAPGPAPPEPAWLDSAELLGTTYWTAPSDVLLPAREFDIYQEMPVLFEST